MYDPELETAVQETYVALDAYHQLIDKELLIRRLFDRGSRFLDCWTLRGFLRNGGWLLRFGADAASRKAVRAVVVTGLASIVHPRLSDFFLTYYALGGIKGIESRFDGLPDQLEALLKRENNASKEVSAVDAYIEVAPTAFKDSIYGEPRPES